jgi:hypothetical protein
MGSVHKESRARLESLRTCDALTHDEWSCMAHALAEIDKEFSDTCRSRIVGFQEIAASQRTRYAACLARPDPELVECGVLTTDGLCLTSRCS